MFLGVYRVQINPSTKILFQKPDLTVCGKCASFERQLREVVDRRLVPELLARQQKHVQRFS